MISFTRPSSPLFFPTREEGLGTRLILISTTQLCDLMIILCTVDAAYEGMMKRTFLAMAIMIIAQLPFLIVFLFMYHKLAIPTIKIENGIMDNEDESDTEDEP